MKRLNVLLFMWMVILALPAAAQQTLSEGTIYFDVTI
jgi:hypothetical protein